VRNDVIELAPSVLAADFARLGEQVAEAERARADRIHVDVMDGHFVPNIAIGAPIVQSLRRVKRLPMETHMMISNPDFFDEFDEAGRLANVLERQLTQRLPPRFWKNFFQISTRCWS
jgi:ribulose-phosphate 3-epimerase